MLNVYYDALITESGADPNEYTWDVFCLEVQHGLVFLIIAFVFLVPEVQASLEPGADRRKADMVKLVCKNLKAAIEIWDCDKFGPGSPLDAMILRAKKNEPTHVWAKEAETMIPTKFRFGRDPTFYERYLESQA